MVQLHLALYTLAGCTCLGGLPLRHRSSRSGWRPFLGSLRAATLGPVRCCGPAGIAEADKGLRVAIVGAGLGGLALAVGLLSAGVDVLVYEKAERLRNASQGAISLWPNGMKALKALQPELPQELLQAGAVPVRSAVLHGRSEDCRAGPSSNVRDLTRMFESFPERFGARAIFAAWTDVQKVLVARVPRSRLRCGKELVAVEGDSSGGAKLRFADGTEATADVVVAADGTFSATRRALQASGQLPPEGGVRFFGQSNWASILQGGWSELLGDTKEEGRMAMLNVSGHPTISAAVISLGGNRMFWQVRATDEKGSLRTSDEAGRLGAPGVRQRVLDLVRGVPELTAAVEATSEESIYERSIYDVHPPLPRYVVGRVVLLGDAAHAPHSLPGQGANFAFEDAAELAFRLGKLPAGGVGLATALEAYEAARLERCHLMQAWAAESGAVQKEGGKVALSGKPAGPEEAARRSAFLYGWEPPV